MEPYVIRGLPNIGATCYLNSILQILCNTMELRSLIRGKINSSNPETSVNEICDAFEEWLSGHINNEITDNTRALRTFIIKFISYYQNFGSGMQDQHEYLMLLLKLLHDSRSSKCMFTVSGTKQSSLDELEERALDNLRKDGMWTSFDSLNTNNQGWNSVIFSTFTGQFHAQTKCSNSTCGYTSHRFETFRILEIDIPSDATGPLTLESCLAWTTRETQLDEADAYECDKCKQRNRAIRKINIWRMPKVLIICIKRFIAVYANGQVRLDKNNSNVSIPEELDVSNYMTVPEIAKGKTKYELYSVAHHIGNQHGGHCYSYLKTPANDWFAVDDGNIHKLNHPSLNGSTPYLLFYR